MTNKSYASDCDECGKTISAASRYCPRCGAKQEWAEREFGNGTATDGGHVGPLILSHEEPRNQFLRELEVITFRAGSEPRTTGDTHVRWERNGKGMANCHVSLLTAVDPKECLEPFRDFVEISGFDSVEQWLITIEESAGHGSQGELPVGHLYAVEFTGTREPLEQWLRDEGASDAHEHIPIADGGVEIAEPFERPDDGLCPVCGWEYFRTESIPEDSPDGNETPGTYYVHWMAATGPATMEQAGCARFRDGQTEPWTPPAISTEPSDVDLLRVHEALATSHYVLQGIADELDARRPHRTPFEYDYSENLRHRAEQAIKVANAELEGAEQ